LLIPAPIEKTRTHLENSPGRSLVLGVVNFTFFGLLAALFISLAEQTVEVLDVILALLTGIIVVGFASFAILGLTAFANLLGERMGGKKTPFRSNLQGGALLVLAALTPYIGWFLFLPLVLWAGFGAAISALFRREKKSPVIEE
jgi:MFS family permease